jgi:spermidine synthase
MVRLLVYVLFLFSGATALVYEVSWTRRLVLELGSTTQVVSLILAAWMTGLALGARLFGKIADRTRRPLLWYAALETGIGLLAIVFPVLLGLMGGVSRMLSLGKAPTMVLAFLVLLLPTTLMGATLPILSKFVIDRMRGMATRIGLLYGLNTVGAVFGTFLAGFYLVETYGVYGASLVAAGANLAVAGAALLLGLLAGKREEEAPLPEEAPDPGISLPRLALVAAFASGLFSLGSEVLWTRMLVFYLEGFTYTFAAMLTTFLAGLSLGALISGVIANRLKSLRLYVGVLFLLSGLVSAGVLFALTRHFEVTNWAKDITAGLFDDWRDHHAASLFLSSFVVLFPPALIMGGIFPAVARMATRHVGEVGSRVGAVYAVNTLGSVAGALVGGLLLTRVIGMAPGAAIFAFLAVGTGMLILGRRWVFGLPVVVSMVLLVFLAHPGTPFVMYSHVFKGERALERNLLSYEEGAYAAVSVVEDVRNGVRAVYTDEFQAAATGPQYKYMRMLAHLPLLFAPQWEGADVLVICFGTGTTAGSASVHPLGRLDIVEICPEVLDQAPRFTSVNKGILSPGRKHPFELDVHVDDGRNYLLRTDRRFDVITLEPLMPYTPGAVSLYSKDFYELCRDRLDEGGVMCQWIPIHAMSSDDYRMLLRSFTEVFPETTLWFVEGTSLVIGTVGRQKIDYGRLVERMALPAIEKDLEEIGFRDPALVLNTFVSGGRDLLAALIHAEVMTDEHPIMEFRPVPYKWPNSFAADNLAVLYHLRKSVAPFLIEETVPEELRAGLGEKIERYYQGGQAFLEARHMKERSAFLGTIGDREGQERFYRQALGAYDRAVELNPADESARYLRVNAQYGWQMSIGILEMERGDLTKAERIFREAADLRNAFKGDLAWTWLGRVRNRLGRHEAALHALDRALEIFPKSPTALAERAFARFELGDVAGAADDFRLALATPDLPPDYDDALRAVMKKVLHRAEQGQLPRQAVGQPAATSLIADLKRAAPSDVADRRQKLRNLYREDPDAVREALAPFVAAARDTTRSEEEQLFALRVFIALGDLPGALDLLKTGAPAVRERAADELCRVKQKAVIPALIAAMRDPDRGVREASWAGLFVLTGKRPEDFDPAGPEVEREAALTPLEEWWREAEPGFEFGR